MEIPKKNHEITIWDITIQESNVAKGYYNNPSFGCFMVFQAGWIQAVHQLSITVGQVPHV